jgi:hypothetical protein
LPVTLIWTRTLFSVKLKWTKKNNPVGYKTSRVLFHVDGKFIKKEWVHKNALLVLTDLAVNNQEGIPI